MMDWKTEGTKLYQQLPKLMVESWEVCEPLRKPPESYNEQASGYKTWNETK